MPGVKDKELGIFEKKVFRQQYDEVFPLFRDILMYGNGVVDRMDAVLCVPRQHGLNEDVLCIGGYEFKIALAGFYDTWLVRFGHYVNRPVHYLGIDFNKYSKREPSDLDHKLFDIGSQYPFKLNRDGASKLDNTYFTCMFKRDFMDVGFPDDMMECLYEMNLILLGHYGEKERF